jgi:hypothetical protein
MRNIVKGVALAAALALWAGPATAVDNLIPGKIGIVKPTKLAKFVSKGTFTLPTGPDAPTTIGGSLAYFDTIFSPAGGETHLLPQSRWIGLGNPPGTKGYKYKGSGSAGDACKVVLIKTTVIKGVCKGSDVTITPPLAGNLGVVLSCGLGTRYCAEFGGTPIKNQAGLFKRKDAPPPGSCPTPGLQTTTTTSTSSTTSSTAPSCCGSERYTLKSSVGTLQVDSLPAFVFPANVTTIMDSSAPTIGLPTCQHDVVVPAGGFVVPNYDITALNYCSMVTANGCESGGGFGKGKLWDGGGTAGLATTGIRKDADTSDGFCDATFTAGTCALSGGTCATAADCPSNTCVTGFCTVGLNACTTNAQCPANSCSSNCNFAAGGVGTNTLGKIVTTRSLGLGGGVRSAIDIPVHSLTWSDSLCSPQSNAGCCTASTYNPSDGDLVISEFDFILSPTTGSATGAFTDLNADGCKRAGIGFATPTQDGPVTLTGSAAAGPCCSVGQASTVVSVGVGFSGGGPLYDLGFKSTIPNTVASCGAAVAGDCTITTDPCLGSPGGAFLD